MGLSEEIIELLTHADDTGGHSLDLGLPFLVQTVVAQDSVGNSSTMERRVRVHGSNNDLQLTVNAGAFFGVSGDKGEGADTFSIETHVLGEGLRERNLVALLDEVSDGKGVTSRVAGSETLVGHVEKGEKFLLFHDI